MPSISFHSFSFPAFQPALTNSEFHHSQRSNHEGDLVVQIATFPSMTPSLQLTAIQLRVSNLDRSMEFYVRRLGFTVARQTSTQADLATSPDSSPLLFLAEQRGATPANRESAGLFHAALLLPGRGALGAWLQLAAQSNVDFEGFSDHGVSEAIYLSDPDGNGLEFYADRPRETWPFANGELAMTTRPLDVRGLLAEGAAADAPPLIGANWGHLHLRVTDLERSEKFYRHTLGMQLMQGSFSGARFLAADGYHHHVAVNTWGGPRLPQPADALGLAEATFARAGTITESVVTDPDGIHLRLQPALVPA
jgi:catechol 2,3-dioxygenase